MAETLITATRPTKSALAALAVVAGLFEAAACTVVLRDPHSAPGTPGSTSELVVYQGDGRDLTGRDLTDCAVALTIDVYTPEGRTTPAAAFETVRGRLGGEADVVCVDLRDVAAKRRAFESHFDSRLEADEVVILFDGRWRKVLGKL